MPNQLSAEVGAETLTIPIKGTAAQIRNVMRRFAISQGLDVTGLSNAKIGRMALRYMLAYAIAEANRQEIAETVAAQNATTEATIRSANNIVTLDDNEP